LSVPPTAVLRRQEPLLLGLLGLALFGLSWELAARVGLIDPILIGSPGRIGEALARQWTSGELSRDFLASLATFTLGFSLATLAGIGLGLLMGLSETLERALDPFIWFLYSAPLVAFYPLMIVLLGFGFATVVALAALLAVVPIVVNTLTAFRTHDQALARAVRAFGGSPLDVVLRVVLPGAVPLMLAGLRIAQSRALIGVVVGEMFGTNLGLGFRLTYYGARLRSADVLVSLLAIVLIGLVGASLLRLAERHLTRWRAA
jgi:NitT/TauT family transport system permease protein